MKFNEICCLLSVLSMRLSDSFFFFRDIFRLDCDQSNWLTWYIKHNKIWFVLFPILWIYEFNLRGLCQSLFVIQELLYIWAMSYTRQASNIQVVGGQDCQEPRLKLFLHKFYGRYNDLVSMYNVSLIHMQTGVVHTC